MIDIVSLELRIRHIAIRGLGLGQYTVIHSLMAKASRALFEVGSRSRRAPSSPITTGCLNTILAAAGARRPDRSFIDDFGDPTLRRGLIDELRA